MATLAKKYCVIVFQVLNETSTSLCRLSADEAYAHNPLVNAIIGETSKCPAKAKAKSVLLPDLCLVSKKTSPSAKKMKSSRMVVYRLFILITSYVNCV